MWYTTAFCPMRHLWPARSALPLIAPSILRCQGTPRPVALRWGGGGGDTVLQHFHAHPIPFPFMCILHNMCTPHILRWGSPGRIKCDGAGAVP